MTNAELAVLSLIVERPRHAYEIESVVAERGMRDWTDLGFSSIYYLLRKMEKAGLVTGTRDAGPSKGPARVVYAPTAAGFEAWTRASLEALGSTQAQSPFLLGLAGLGALPADEALAAARRCLAGLEQRRAEVCQKRREQRGQAWFVDELFDYSETTLQCGRDWVAGFVERFEHRR